MAQNAPTRTTSVLTFSRLALGFTAILFSWALFLLLPGGMLVVACLPFWLLLVWAFSVAVQRSGWRLAVQSWQVLLFWLIVLVLVVLAPIYSYIYGYYHATRLFLSLGIAAGEVETVYSLLDRFGDVGQERYFAIRYQVFEPLEEAETKLRQRFANKADWYIDGPNPNYLYPLLVTVRCTTPKYFGLIGSWNFPGMTTGVVILESEILSVTFVYEQPRSCTDIE
jgi:hypothetical protein